MQFTILGHAALSVEHRGTTLVFDPWLVGSCYWRSWWNYPELDRGALERSVTANAIYLTHLHWDHFHGPSLRRFSRSTRVLVPKIHSRRMVEDLRGMGFNEITEVAHGETVALGPDLALTSFQFGMAADSAAVVTAGETTLFNANDCKLFGAPLRHLRARFPRIDFVLRSYSSASAIPYCIDGYERRFPNLRRPEDYIQEFARFAIHVGATFAVPFASNHCFLHQDTIRYNALAVSPEAVVAHLNAEAEALGVPTRGVVMAPGSRWSEASGFELRAFDYEQRDAAIAELRAKKADKLEATERLESAAVPDWPAFEAYMKPFLAAVPRLPLRRLLRLRVTFAVGFGARPRVARRYFELDFFRRRVREVPAPDPRSLIVDIDAAVLNDCTHHWMFSTLAPSKRLRFHLPEGGSWVDVRLLLSLLDLYELELIPLRRNLSPRHLEIWARRWREFLEGARVVFEHQVLRRPFRVRDLYPVPEPPASAPAPRPPLGGAARSW